MGVGDMLVTLEEAQQQLRIVKQQSTERYERQLAEATTSVAGVLEVVVVMLREHLACHDCEVARHFHDTLVPGFGSITSQEPHMPA